MNKVIVLRLAMLVALLVRTLSVNAYLGPNSGDLNADSQFTQSDISCLIQASLMSIYGELPSCLAVPVAQADLNCDGNLNVVDVQWGIVSLLSQSDNASQFLLNPSCDGISDNGSVPVNDNGSSTCGATGGPALAACYPCLDNANGGYIIDGNIKDPVLLKALKKQLGFVAPIQKSLADSLKELISVGGREKIKSLEGIQCFPNLERLTLVDHAIQDMDPVSTLTKLERLNLSKNQIADLKALTNLFFLKTIELSQNQIEDVTPIIKLPVEILEALVLDSNLISDLSILWGHPFDNMTEFSMADNYIDNVNFFATTPYPKLTHLNLSSNQLGDIAALAGGEFYELKNLFLENNLIQDISVLDNFKQLTGLHLNNNQIWDVTTIANLEKIQDLSLGDNPIMSLAPIIDNISGPPPFLVNVALGGIEDLFTNEVLFDQLNQLCQYAEQTATKVYTNVSNIYSLEEKIDYCL